MIHHSICEQKEKGKKMEEATTRGYLSVKIDGKRSRSKLGSARVFSA